MQSNNFTKLSLQCPDAYCLSMHAVNKCCNRQNSKITELTVARTQRALLEHQALMTTLILATV